VDEVAGASVLRPPPQRIADERHQAGESVAGIGVVLDDVEGEVVRTAECPDGQCQEQADLERRRFQEQQDAGGDAISRRRMPLVHSSLVFLMSVTARSRRHKDIPPHLLSA